MTRSLLAVIATATAASLPVFMTGALSVQMRAGLGYSETLHGLAFGAFFGAAALGSAMLGRLAERIGATRALRVTALLGAALQLAIALGARSWWMLAMLLAACGLVTALAQPSANLLLARAIPDERQGFAFGLKQSAIPGATLLGGLAVPVIALTLGWRWAFGAGALLSLTAAATVPPIDPIDSEAERTSRGARDAPRDALIALSVGIGFGAAAAGGVAAFLVSTGVHAGLGEATAAWALTLGSALCIASRLWLGARADRRRGDPLKTVTALLWIGSVGFAVLGIGDRHLHLVATIAAFGAGWAWPGLFNLAVVRASPRSPGAATGVTQTGTYIGALGGPACFGLLVDTASFGVAWATMTAFAIVAGLAIAEGRRRLAGARSG